MAKKEKNEKKNRQTTKTEQLLIGTSQAIRLSQDGNLAMSIKFGGLNTHSINFHVRKKDIEADSKERKEHIYGSLRRACETYEDLYGVPGYKISDNEINRNKTE